MRLSRVLFIKVTFESDTPSSFSNAIGFIRLFTSVYISVFNTVTDSQQYQLFFTHTTTVSVLRSHILSHRTHRFPSPSI